MLTFSHIIWIILSFCFGSTIANATCIFFPHFCYCCCNRCRHRHRRRRLLFEIRMLCAQIKWIHWHIQRICFCAFRFFFFFSVRCPFAQFLRHRVVRDGNKKKSNIFSWLKINWMNLSQLYGCTSNDGAKEKKRMRSNASERERANTNYFFSVRARDRREMENCRHRHKL